MEKAARCQMCGTADWEWEADRYAYEPAVRLSKPIRPLVSHGKR